MTSNTPRQNCDESQITTQEGVLSYFRKVGNADIGVYSLHLKSNLITHGNAEICSSGKDQGHLLCRLSPEHAQNKAALA